MGEHVAVNFEQGFWIGEMCEIKDTETVKVSFMKTKTVATGSHTEHKSKFWIWPYPEETRYVKRQCILSIRPAGLVLAVPPSTNRV